MGHDKLRKFAENEHFSCLLQPSTRELMPEGYFSLQDHPVKGRWASDFFKAPGHPIVLELGCGKGEYTTALAERDPGSCYIGVDIKGARLWKGAKYATERGMTNVGFLRSRIEFIKAFFGPAEVDEIWLTFSDPQIRKENARLTSPMFLERYKSFLKPGGVIHLKTDSRFLHEYTKAVCRANCLRVMACTEDLYGAPADAPVPASAGAVNLPSDSPASSPVTGTVPPVAREVQTFYESIFLRQGYRINYLAFTLERESGSSGTSAAPCGSSAAGAATAPCATFVSPSDFDADYWRSVEGPRQLFGRDTAETRRQKLHKDSISNCQQDAQPGPEVASGPNIVLKQS